MHTQFPLGELPKPKVREIAEEQGLINARKHDSQDICFVTSGNYTDFIRQYTGKEYPEGDFVDRKGNVLGRHKGIIHYNGLIAGHEDKWAIVAGLNLPMLIDAYASRMMMDTAHEVAAQISGSGKEGVRIYPESLEPKKEEAAPAAVAAPQGAIPEGTVLGDGHIKIGLTRIDTRLLHGQVATTWTKMVNPDRIIVVSDAVSKDDLRKRMIIEAAPPGVKAHVIPIWKMIEVSKDPRFGETKAMLLFETPQDVLKAIEGGVDIKEVNLGSLAHSTGKVVVTKAVAMGKEDVETFEKLIDKGVTFNVRKVPSDSPENMGEMLKKAKAELK